MIFEFQAHRHRICLNGCSSNNNNNSRTDFRKPKTRVRATTCLRKTRSRRWGPRGDPTLSRGSDPSPPFLRPVSRKWSFHRTASWEGPAGQGPTPEVSSLKIRLTTEKDFWLTMAVFCLKCDQRTFMLFLALFKRWGGEIHYYFFSKLKCPTFVFGVFISVEN